MQKEFAEVIQKISEAKGEVPPDEIMQAFRKEYLDLDEPFKLINMSISDIQIMEAMKIRRLNVRIKYNG